jgi:hypothetical protein
MKQLSEISSSIVSNLHQSLVFRSISEFQKKDALDLRNELGIAGFSESQANPLDLLEAVKRYIFETAFDDKNIIEFLMQAPLWIGFKPDKEYLETAEQAILAGKRSALAILWIAILPKICTSPTILPSEIEKQGVEVLVESLLKSDESRAELNRIISLELMNRGFVEEYFDISGIDSGFLISDGMKNSRLKALIALIIMKLSGCPFDLDKVFSLPEHRLIEETTLYIITMQTMASLSFQISGSGFSKPFDWPLIGTARVFSRLMSTLDILRRAASKMSTCSLFSPEGKVWAEWEFTSYLISKIAEYYTNLLRTKSGKGKNKELGAFISILNGENIEITTQVMESNDKPSQLYEELSDCKRRAMIGEKPQISPERRFRVVLAGLKQRLERKQSDSIDMDEIVEEIADVFDAIAEIIEKHVDSLSSQVDKFAEEMCFETSFRILEVLNLASALGDLPWVSRFIAEEATRMSISRGDIDSLSEKHRVKRIVLAFASGVAYLVLQAQNLDYHQRKGRVP